VSARGARFVLGADVTSLCPFISISRAQSFVCRRGDGGERGERANRRSMSGSKSINQSIRGRGDISTPLNKGYCATPGGGVNFSGGIFLSADFPFSFSPAIPFYYLFGCDSISRFARRPLPPSSVVSIDARFLPAFFTLTRRKQMNLRVENLNGGKRVDAKKHHNVNATFLYYHPNIHEKKARPQKNRH